MLDLSAEEEAVLLPLALQIGEHIRRMRSSRDVKDRPPEELRAEMQTAIDAALVCRGLLGAGQVGWSCDGSTIRVWIDLRVGDGQRDG